MPVMSGTLLFSHILPFVLAFFGILFIISGAMDDDKPKFLLGLLLFIVAAIGPFIILRPLVL